jgi:hypothetical protein
MVHSRMHVCAKLQGPAGQACAVNAANHEPAIERVWIIGTKISLTKISF